jgi:hypothetical protein
LIDSHWREGVGSAALEGHFQTGFGTGCVDHPFQAVGNRGPETGGIALAKKSRRRSAFESAPRLPCRSI